MPEVEPRTHSRRTEEPHERFLETIGEFNESPKFSRSKFARYNDPNDLALHSLSRWVDVTHVDVIHVCVSVLSSYAWRRFPLPDIADILDSLWTSNCTHVDNRSQQPCNHVQVPKKAVLSRVSLFSPPPPPSPLPSHYLFRCLCITLCILSLLIVDVSVSIRVFQNV